MLGREEINKIIGEPEGWFPPVEKLLPDNAKEFIMACCRQRLYLNSTGRSKNMDDLSHDIANGIMNEIQTIYGEQTMAAYFLKKSADLVSLLPGKDCKGVEKRWKIYNDLKVDAEEILKSKQIISQEENDKE